ncbi:hypothetical protein G6N82_14660 [Altererythrobacter sp. BO-6]|uniref:hypothetical protein n=1 Tax=Altererythrobacter sp. BO-6 TaxID=2604537 RepID=UPI0013E18BA2|nr:hypothetical protein [Altererythrobacter sp. BO-6]QIG55224.1 hypothetical protein G6N82_14660 [Altererythrobacter sp. BO-6]
MQRALTIVFAAMALAACGSEPASEPLVAPPELAEAFIEGAKAQPASDTPIADPWQRAGTSFSKYPLGEEVLPQAVGRLRNGEICDDGDILCEWEDESGVVHIFGGPKLAIKLIDVYPDTGPIAALGIGDARQQGDVLKNVRAFLPEVKVTCLSAGEAGEGEGISSCGADFTGGGWIKLLFGADGTLKTARIDAFQID